MFSFLFSFAIIFLIRKLRGRGGIGRRARFRF
jgi:hypothetical protein